MRCIYCGFTESKVIDSRPTDESKSIRRRRECLGCKKRFTTYEIVEILPMIVIKKNKDRQVFDRNKLVNGILRACINRPVSVETIEKIADKIENELQNSLEQEVSSDHIAQLALQELRKIDEVSYVRFASVANNFDDVNSFFELLKELQKQNEEK